MSSKEPAQQKIGEFITFYYPDGTIQSDGRHVPDFEKLQIIRHEVEGKKRCSSTLDHCTEFSEGSVR